VERLKKELDDTQIIVKSKNIGYYFRADSGVKCFIILIAFNQNKICNIFYDDENDVTDFKWLYELWINGNEIINDLEVPNDGI
jgi:hypothetical protein